MAEPIQGAPRAVMSAANKYRPTVVNPIMEEPGPHQFAHGIPDPQHQQQQQMAMQTMMQQSQPNSQ